MLCILFENFEAMEYDPEVVVASDPVSFSCFAFLVPLTLPFSTRLINLLVVTVSSLIFVSLICKFVMLSNMQCNVDKLRINLVYLLAK